MSRSFGYLVATAAVFAFMGFVSLAFEVEIHMVGSVATANFVGWASSFQSTFAAAYQRGSSFGYTFRSQA